MLIFSLSSFDVQNKSATCKRVLTLMTYRPVPRNVSTATHLFTTIISLWFFVVVVVRFLINTHGAESVHTNKIKILLIFFFISFCLSNLVVVFRDYGTIYRCAIETSPPTLPPSRLCSAHPPSMRSCRA